MKYTIFISILLTSITSSNASFILQPTGVTTNGVVESDLSVTIDQSGLTENYISGVTDFDSFVITASSPTSVNNPIGSAILPLPISFDFNLGTNFFINAIALWNVSGGTSIESLDLYTAKDVNFNTALFIGSYDSLNENATANVIRFNTVDAQFVRIIVTDNINNSDITRFEEFAVRGSPVPIPATLWLFGSGLLSFLVLQKNA